MLKESVINVSYLQIKYASPFPSNLVKDYLEKAKMSILIEENRLSVQLDDGTFGQRGQMELVIRSLTGMSVDKRILKLNTRSFSMEEIHDYVKQLLNDKSIDTIFGDRI